MNTNFIPWSTFLGLCLVIFLIWIITTQTQVGRRFVRERTSWTRRQWDRVLLIAVATLFIMVNPVYHLIGTGVAVVLYFLFVDRRNIKKTLLKSDKRTLESSSPFSTISLKKPQIYISCKGKQHKNMIKERNILEKCLFSFPFIEDTPFPKVQYMDETYHIDLNLSDEKYYDSLISYLDHAGFDILMHKIKG